MIKSMTGFGQAELGAASGAVRVEIKSTNHKFLEISVRLPNHLLAFEEPVRKRVSQDIQRGKVTLFVQSPDPAVMASRLVLNEALAREASQKVVRLKKLLGVKEKLPAAAFLKLVLSAPDVLTKEASLERTPSNARVLLKAVEKALQSLERSKLFEGRALEKDLRRRISEIRSSLRAIERCIPAGVKEYKRSLEKKMKEFLKDGEMDRERLTLEIALYVKNSDISEEVTRLKSHLQAMQKTLSEHGELGRKIDFIAQEMNREVNTIGAKSADGAIANAVIAMKGAVEKIREQAQNVE